MEIKFPGQVIKKFLNNKFSENPFCGIRFVPCADGQMEGQRDRTKLIAACSNFMGASKNIHNIKFVFYFLCAFCLKHFSLLEEFSEIS